MKASYQSGVVNIKIYDVYILEAKKTAAIKAMQMEEDRTFWEDMTADGALVIHTRKSICENQKNMSLV